MDDSPGSNLEHNQMVIAVSVQAVPVADGVPGFSNSPLHFRHDGIRQNDERHVCGLMVPGRLCLSDSAAPGCLIQFLEEVRCQFFTAGKIDEFVILHFIDDGSSNQKEAFIVGAKFCLCPKRRGYVFGGYIVVCLIGTQQLVKDFLSFHNHIGYCTGTYFANEELVDRQCGQKYYAVITIKQILNREMQKQKMNLHTSEDFS